MRSQVAKVIGTALGIVPVARWPSLVSRFTGVLTPRATVPHKAPSASGGANVGLLFDCLKRTASLEGDVAECGVWRGRTLIAMGLYLKQRRSTKTAWGFDSFEGFVGAVPHNFKDTSPDIVKEKLDIFSLSNVRLIPGYFRESFAVVKDRRFSFVHIDCDVYDSYQECLSFFYPRLVSGGIILFDEYNDPDWPGATRAVDEFCHAHAIPVQVVERDNFRKSYITAP